MAEERIITIKDVDYIVSSDGKVYSANNRGRAKYHQEILQRKNADGYMQITVGKTGNRSQYRVHRMVAEAFIPNLDKLPEINHKDNDRTNNRVDNLEWCTHVYNIQYAIDSGNHISATDITGSNNPNYGNRVLHERYKNNPELARENQGRPGAQNGRAKKIKLFDVVKNQEIIFGYIKAAAVYLIESGYTKAKDPDALLGRLSACAKKHTKYKGRFCVEFVD